MFELESKAIQINGDRILCQDGSIWEINGDSLEKIAFHKGKTRIKKDAKGYTEQFEEFWKTWGAYMRNSCSKMDSYSKWAKLKTEEHEKAIKFIEQYSASDSKHNYLKRANTYLSGKIWESAEHIESSSAHTLPPLHDMRWNKPVYNKEIGITETARDQIKNFGMDMNEAWELVNASI